MDHADPIIMTLQFDAAAAEHFERMRQTHFPPALNVIGAHLTLFHQLPGDEADAVMSAAADISRQPPFPMAVDGLMPLGRGVAYRLSSETLVALRTALAQRFTEWLTGQDREKFRPHVTIQNKVSPAQARQTLTALQQGFVPFTATAEGLQLWHYRGGPWSPLAAVAFSAR